MMKSLGVLLTCAFALSLVAPADAAPKKKRAAKRAPIATQQPAFRQEPARMIEIRPGYWISSYGCFTDDGNGRINPCDLPDSSY